VTTGTGPMSPVRLPPLVFRGFWTRDYQAIDN
jgi:hypothetical protein